LNDALKSNSLFFIQALLMSFNSSKASHMEKENELFGNLQQRATKNHTAYMIFTLFRKEIEETKLSAPVKQHLTELLILFGLDVLVKDSHLLFEGEYFGPGNATQVFEAKKA